MSKIIKRIVILLVAIGLIILVFYGRSFKGKHISISHSGIMYSKKAYENKDYDNLDVREVTFRFNGGHSKRWFREHSLIGYMDIDLFPIEDTVNMPINFRINNYGFSWDPDAEIVYQPAHIMITEQVPLLIRYKDLKQEKTTYLDYGSVYLNKGLKEFYLELGEDTGFEGYCVVAPADSIEDIDYIIENVFN